MKYKLIAADCDDTILNSSYTYSQRLKKAIQRYVDKGGKFVIATGRMTEGILDYCRDLGLHGEVITYQGAVTADIDSGKILDMNTISYEEAAKVAAYLENKGVYFHLYLGDVFIVDKATERTIGYAEFCKVTYREVHEKLSDFITHNEICPLKLMAFVDPEDTFPLIHELSEHFSHYFIINSSKNFMVEIVPNTVSKGFAVEKLAKKYNIKRQEVICIGDSGNDVSMLKYAGLSFAVSNGTKEAIDAADMIAPSNDEDGVAYVIEEYGLI